MIGVPRSAPDHVPTHDAEGEGRGLQRFERRRVGVGDLTIAYREARSTSQGPPLVLVHGLGMSSRFFARLLPHLAEHHRVLALDLPGCGASDRPQEALDVGELVDVIVGWMDAVGVQRSDVLGHSLGGQVVGRLAARHPGRVRRIVLVACTPDPSAPRVRQKVVRLVRDSAREPWPIIRDSLVDYVRARPLLAARTLTRALHTDVDIAAQAIEAPTLVVHGDRDAVISLEWSHTLARLIPDARCEVIPGGTHALPAQSPAALAARVRAFLAAP